MKKAKITDKLKARVLLEARGSLPARDWKWLCEFATVGPYVTTNEAGDVVLKVSSVHDDVSAIAEWALENKIWKVRIEALYLLDNFEPSWVPVIKNMYVAPNIPGALKATIVSALAAFQERLTRLAKAAALHMVSVIKEKKKDGY